MSAKCINVKCSINKAEMQTGEVGKRREHCVDQGHAPNRIYFKDICFKCSFVVTLRYFLLP